MQSVPYEDHRPAGDGPLGMQPPGDSRPAMHPLARLITDAAAGRFPAVDGGWRRVPPWRPGLDGIIAFTGHAVLALAPDITDGLLTELGVNGLGGAHDPRVIAALAGPAGWIDSLDVLLAGRGTAAAPAVAGPRLVQRLDLASHHRALFAASIRDRPRVLGYPDRRRSAVVVFSRGLAGLTEISFELEPDQRGSGGGAPLIRDALSTIPAGQLVIAASRQAMPPASARCWRQGSLRSARCSCSAAPAADG